MKTQLKLRLALLFYLGLLLITPKGHAMITVHVASTITAASASIAFLVYLLSRKPVERNILNRQLVLLFVLKLISFPYYSGLRYFQYRYLSQLQSQQEDWEGWELLLTGTLFSLSSTRIVVILNILMYTLFSAYRTLLFISPSKFNYLNKKKVLYSSILIVVLVFVFEILMSQVVFSPARCEINARGNRIHSLVVESRRETNFNMSTNLNKSSTEMPALISSEVSNVDTNLNITTLNDNIFSLESGKTCTLFPSGQILTFIFLLLEAIRFTFAVTRKYRMIKGRKIVPIQVNAVQSIGLQMRPQRILTGNISTGLNEPDQSRNIEERRLVLQSLTGNIVLSPGLNEPEQSRQSGSESNPNASRSIEEKRFFLLSLSGNTLLPPGLNEPEPLRHSGSDPNLNAPKKTIESSLVLQSLTGSIILPPGHNEQGPSRYSGSDLNLNAKASKSIEESSMVLQSLTGSIILPPGHNDQDPSRYSGSVSNLNAPKRIKEKRLDLLSSYTILPPGLNDPEQSMQSGSEPNLNTPNNIAERRMTLQSLTGNIILPPGLNEPKPSRHSGSESNFNVQQIIEKRRLSLPILPLNPIEPPGLNEPEQVIDNTHQDHTAQTLSDIEKMKNYVSFLILRTYTLIIVFMFIFMFYITLPIHILSWLDIRGELVSIDVYFIPVFWILYEKEAWSYTVKNVKKMYFSVLLRFYSE